MTIRKNPDEGNMFSQKVCKFILHYMELTTAWTTDELCLIPGMCKRIYVASLNIFATVQMTVQFISFKCRCVSEELDPDVSK